MKTILYIISFVLLTIATQSCSFNAVKGNGNIAENEINISDYSQIKFSGGATLHYEQKNDTTPYLRIEVDENIFPLLTIENSDNVLRIYNKENIRPTRYNIYTNSATLKSLEASGSITALIKGKLETQDLNIALSGSGDITIDSLVCQNLETKISGSADMAIKGGKASFIKSIISGSGKINTIAMQADSTSCITSGSGDFKVWSDKYLKIEVSGSGNVEYKGNPQIDKAISGSGKVTQVH